MMTISIKTILEQLNTTGSSVTELLQLYQSEAYAGLWTGDVRLYQAFGRKLIQAGHPARAYELVRAGLLLSPNDLELQYWRALALARGGNLSKASMGVQELLGQIVQSRDTALSDGPERLKHLEHLEVEALSLAGRIEKDAYARSDNPVLQQRFGSRSADAYERAYRISGDPFPGVNAATMSLLMGRHEQARALARETITRVRSTLDSTPTGVGYWSFATLGEAHLVLGDLPEATRWYEEAVRQAQGHRGDIAAMRRNVLLLKDKGAADDTILQIFHLGRVVAFSGHMLDHPDRVAKQGLTPRFPANPELEHDVSIAIQQMIDELDARVGYCSAACGADILFAERMLERHAELHVMLPFDKNDFYRTSVDYGLPEMADWRRRCDAVLERATVVHYATRESYLGDDVLFAFVNTVMFGLAIMRAAELGVTPAALTVLDPASRKLLGGTKQHLDEWTERGNETYMIDLAALRTRHGGGAAPVPHQIIAAEEHATPQNARREIKVMIFADVQNFSKLSEAQTPTFFLLFLAEVAALVDASTTKPVFCNTWGDGLFLVFDHVIDGADFAMRLLDRIESIDWSSVGLPSDITVRLGIHAGPVFPTQHPILRRGDFFGSHVNRAARIEPVTTPGCAYASEQFAAALSVVYPHAFVCEYVGIEQLAKEYDRIPLYRLGGRR